MRVNINSVHFKADHKLLTFINDKIEKLSQVYDGVIGSEVSLKVDNNEGRDNKIAEIRLNLPGRDLYAKKQSKSFEESTDTAVEALRRQLKKYKDKQRRK
jgi:putative sigma-54 modulation protein